jgi:ribosomal 50S subunit-recycling heat shock protein
VRLDLFLKWSRLIPRRTVAKATCDAGKVRVNGIEAAAGREIRCGDMIRIQLARRILTVRAGVLPAVPPPKDQSRHIYELVEERRVEES